jgi:hypothetical protein
LLWPIAWLWAYSKPVFYKMAYGTDRVDHTPGDAHAVVVPPAPDLAVVGSGHHGAAALGATDLPALGTVPMER